MTTRPVAVARAHVWSSILPTVIQELGGVSSSRYWLGRTSPSWRFNNLGLRRFPSRRFTSGLPVIGVDASYAPLCELQTVYDEVLDRPWRYPPHVRRLHALAQREQLLRQKEVDQTPLDVGKNTLFTARKVIYAVVARHDHQYQVCATRFSCAQDFMERASQNASRDAANTSKRKKRLSWLAEQGLENVLLYPLESLASDDIPYVVLAGARLKHWTGILEDVDRGMHVYADPEILMSLRNDETSACSDSQCGTSRSGTKQEAPRTLTWTPSQDQ